MLDLIFGQASSVGKLGRENEDAMGVFVPESPKQTRSHGWMFVVADGVGGSGLGDIASKAAIAAMETGYATASNGASLVTLLPDLVQRANAAVHNEMWVPERRGKRMATAIVACALRQNQAVVSHVGDSRCYHIRGGRAVAMTNDHTLVNEQRSLGLITEMFHVLTRSLGTERFVLVDTATFSIEAGDMLVLCTDGLHRAMYESDIARIASGKNDIQQIAEDLNRYAIEADGSDNSTVQVISIRSVENLGCSRSIPTEL